MANDVILSDEHTPDFKMAILNCAFWALKNGYSYVFAIILSK